MTLHNQNLLTVIHNTATTGTVDASVFSIANRSDYATGAGPYALAIADLDGDGKADVAVTNVVGNTVSIFRNTGSGGAIAFAAKVDLPTGTYPNSISIADIDGDGKPDLVVSDWYVNGTVSIFRNQATSGVIGIASFVPKLDMPAGANPHAVAISDIDGDGRPDLIVANSYDNTLWVLQKM